MIDFIHAALESSAVHLVPEVADARYDFKSGTFRTGEGQPITDVTLGGENVPREEVERRALGTQRLSAAFSSIAWHTRKAANQPDYWNVLYASQVNR